MQCIGVRRLTLTRPANAISNMIQAFLHIPKTSGTTIREYLKPHYSEKESIFWYGNSDFKENYRGISKRLNKHTKLVFGHYHFGIHELTDRKVCYHTILRNPVQRMQSYYLFARSRNADSVDIPDVINTAQQTDIIEFFSQYTEICNEQCRYLSPRNPQSVANAIINLEQMNFGLQDYTALFMRDLCRLLKLPELRYKNRKVSKNKLESSQAELKQLTSMCELDMELYRKAREVYFSRQSLLPLLPIRNTLVEKHANFGAMLHKPW